MRRGAPDRMIQAAALGGSEGWINRLLGGQWEARSAGTAPAARVHPLAVRAMAESGVDISGGRPEHVGLHLDQPWDLVVTVCDSAKETCPVFPRPVEKIHVSFFDPAAAEGTAISSGSGPGESRCGLRGPGTRGGAPE
jgi:protein-tyrosine-phosphatase